MPKKYINTQSIKDKHGNLLHDPQDILERWAQYVEELYDDTRSSVDKSTDSHERCVISELEVNTVIQKLTRNKATGSDNIPAEFLQSLGEKGIQMITRLMNLIYNTGILPDDFLRNIFITIPRRWIWLKTVTTIEWLAWFHTRQRFFYIWLTLTDIFLIMCIYWRINWWWLTTG